MGVPVTGGARGSISIDTSQLAAARAGVQSFATAASASLNSVSPAARAAGLALNSAASSALGLTGARTAIQSFATGAIASLNSVSQAARRTALDLRATATAAATGSRAKFAGTALATGVGSLGGPMGAMAGAMAGANPAIAVGVIAAGVVKGAAAATMASSNLTEAINKTSVAFGASDRQILEWSKNSDTALAMSRHQALEAASSFGLLFATIGVAPEASAEMSKSLVQLAADMASINNISPEEALTKLRAGLVGEIEPLRSVGVLLNAAAVEAKVMEMGLADSTGAITEQNKVMARYQLILEQTKLTQGDLGRTSGELANQIRFMEANWQNLMAAFGTMIEPAITDIITDLNAILQETIRVLNAYNASRASGKEETTEGGGYFEERAAELGAAGKEFSDWRSARKQSRADADVVQLEVMLARAQEGLVTLQDQFVHGLVDEAQVQRQIQLINDFAAALAEARGIAGTGAVPAWMTGVSSAASGPLLPARDPAAGNEAKMDWARGVNDINKQLHDDIISAESSYGQQRADTIRSYQKGVAREERDFNRGRLRANLDFLDSVADVYKGQASREAKVASDLARASGQARADSAERLSDMQADLDRTNAEKRSDSAEQVTEWETDRAEAEVEIRAETAANLLELEEDYAKARLRAQTDHRDTMLGAAARLDAVAIYNAQKAYARQQADADAAHQEELDEERKGLSDALVQIDDAHKERLEDERKSLEKSISQANEAHARAVADEKESLDKQLTQMQEAHALQLEEGRANDALRLEEMKADFAERQAREDEDRAIRKSDQAQDHADQLAEMATAHGLRMNQLRENALREREQLQIEHEAEMVRLGAADAAMKARVEAREKVLIDSYDRVWDHMEKRAKDFLKQLEETAPRTLIGGPVQAYAAGGPVTATGLAMVHQGEYVIPANAARGGTSHTTNSRVGDVAISIYATPNQDAGDIGAEVELRMRSLLGNMAGGYPN